MNLSQKAKQAVAAGLAVSTLMWSAALFVAMPAFAAPHSEGCLVNSGGTVYLVTGGQRRGFTSAEVFASHGYNFGQVVAANAEDTALPVGPIMVYADGSIVKGPNDPLVYLVANGQKRGFVSGSVFTGLGYSFANIQWAPVNTFSDLPTGANVETSTERHPAGTWVKDGTGTVWMMTATGRKGVPSMEVFNSYGKAWGTVVAANAADLATSNEGVMTARSMSCGGSAPVSGAVTVSMSSDSPAAGTLIAGQAAADLAHFMFTGSGTVTGVTLQRTGVSADSTLSSVYLYEGNVRLSDSATVSSGVITFNNPTGLFTVNGSKNISVRSNIASGTSGQTVGVKLNAATLLGGSVAAGTPSGNTFTVAATPSNFATVDFNATTTPSGSTIQPQTDYVMWQNVVSVGNTPVLMKSLKLRQIGSVNSGDLGNFKLFVDGVQVGTGSMDSQSYVNFDLGAGVTLNTGSRTIKLVGDIIGGSNRTFQFSLRQASDAMFVDTQFSQPVLATAASSTFSARDAGSQQISTGTLTISKRSDSASGNVVIEASDVSLAKFDVKAAGEAMKIESMRVSVVESDSATDLTLRNGKLFVDGSQVGSTTAIAATTDNDVAYTEFTFGSSFIVNPGQTRVLEVRADIYDNDGSEDIEDADTLTVRIEAMTGNVQRMSSLGYGDFPAVDTDGSQVTVSTGSLTVAKNTSYGDHTIVVPRTAYKIGSYNIQASTTEGANITSLVVDFDEVADIFDASDDLTNLYITAGSYTSPVKTTVSDTGNTFSTNLSIAAGQVIEVSVYADIGSLAGDGGSADTGESSLTVSYTTSQSSTSTSASEVDGQTITFTNAGSFSTAVAGSTPAARIVAGNQTVTAAEYDVTAVNDSFTVKEVTVKVASASAASAINYIQLYDGATAVGSATPLSQSSNTAALITGLNISVPAGTTKTLVAKAILNNIGTGAGTSQVDAALTLDNVKYATSAGVENNAGTDRAGNSLYVYKSVPTVAKQTVTKTDIVNGTQYDLYKFTVTASSAGNVYLKQFQLATTWNDNATTADTLEVEQLKLYEDNTDITANVVIQDEDGNSVESTNGMVEADGTLTISWATGLQGTVPAGATRTYVVKGVITGFTDAADSVTFQLLGDAAHNSTKVYLNGTATATTIWGLHTAAAATGSGTNYNFIWSDASGNPHAAAENASSSADWANGYKVLDLDLSTESWTKDI